jgi:hypothetical protein
MLPTTSSWYGGTYGTCGAWKRLCSRLLSSFINNEVFVFGFSFSFSHQGACFAACLPACMHALGLSGDGGAGSESEAKGAEGQEEREQGGREESVSLVISCCQSEHARVAETEVAKVASRFPAMATTKASF